jgi:hypothetical protein
LTLDAINSLTREEIQRLRIDRAAASVEGTLRRRFPIKKAKSR